MGCGNDISEWTLFMAKFFIGLLLGVGISYLAYRAGALNRGGGVAAGVLGTIVFGLGGLGWAAVLLTFFISSSALSKTFKQRKAEVGTHFSKGSRRDAAQVAANGGVAGFLVLLYFIFLQIIPESNCSALLWVGFAASLAGANADTWATELGLLNPRQPLLLTTFRRVPKGTSGAVSAVGTLAALAGSMLVAGAAILSSLAGWAPDVGLSLGAQFLLISLAGLAGSSVDSLLGATLQAVYFCPHCKKETERYPFHTCGVATLRVRGLPWLNNDWVNTACTLSAGLIGCLLAFFF